MVSVAGCGQHEPPPAAPTVAQKAQPDESKTYKLVGVVKAVDLERGVVRIKHDEIPGFMDAMEMPFKVKDKRLLEDVRPGDEVEGSLRVDYDGKVVKDYDLASLTVTRPASPASLTLNLASGNPALKPAARRLEPGQEVPDFRFTTQDGKEVKLSDERGKVVVLTFIYTRCPLPDFCPAMDRKFADLAAKLEAVPERAAQVKLLSVSFDPEHDTPKVLAEHARVQGARPPLWTFAVATHPELYKVMAPLGLAYGPTGKEIVHNLTTAVIDRDGRLVRLESGKGWTTSDLLKTIVPLLAPKGG